MHLLKMRYALYADYASTSVDASDGCATNCSWPINGREGCAAPSATVNTNPDLGGEFRGQTEQEVTEGERRRDGGMERESHSVTPSLGPSVCLPVSPSRGRSVSPSRRRRSPPSRSPRPSRRPE